MSGFQGKVVVITGGAGEIGKAAAKLLSAEGADVLLVDRDAKALNAAVTEIGSKRVATCVADVTDVASTQGYIRAAVDRFGGIDVLLSNAGIEGKVAPIFDADPADVDRVIAVNVRGVWLVVKALAPLLKKSTLGGRIVNVASDTALWGAPRLLHYVGSKGAVISMTRALARELGPDNITVNAIAPGITIVEATEYVPQERHDLDVNNRAIQRKQMPDDTVGPVIYLLGPGAGFVTGQLLPVNGGFVCN